MDILRGDRLILTKEYDKMKMVGMTYEVANISCNDPYWLCNSWKNK